MTSRQRFWQELEEFRNFCNFVTNLDDCFCMADGVLSVDKNKTFLSVIGRIKKRNGKIQRNIANKSRNNPSKLDKVTAVS